MEIKLCVLQIIQLRYFEFEQIFRFAGEGSAAKIANIVFAGIENAGGFVEVANTYGIEPIGA